MATRIDTALICGSDQLCAGLKAGIEGTIHVMNGLFSTHQDQSSGWGVLLVDAATHLTIQQCFYMLVCFGHAVQDFFFLEVGHC